MLTYEYIEQSGYDLLLIMQSRVSDYLNEDAVAVDEAEMALAREFYADVRAGEVDGYHLVFSSDYGLAFVSDELYAQYFSAKAPAE